MKTSKLITYLIGSTAIVILMVFIAKFAPRLLLASRPMSVTQTISTTSPIENAWTVTPAALPMLATSSASPNSTNVSSNQEITSEITTCTFDASLGSILSVLPLDAYTFSEPKVVLTNATTIKLIQWLPDGQRILLTRSSNSYLRIETFNVDAHNVQIYGETAQAIVGQPVWLPADQSVLFVENTANNRNILHIDRGVNQSVKSLQTNFATLFFSVDADIRHTILSAIASTDSTDILRTAYSVHPSPQVESYRLLIANSEEEYQASLFSDGGKVTLYNSKGFYLVNLAGQTCKYENLSLDGKWTLNAKWSADERYLALITAPKFYPNLLSLEIFDSLTGNQRVVDLAGGMVSSIDWHPSYDTLLVTAQNTPQDPVQNYYDGLYLVNGDEGIAKRFLENHQYIAIGYWGALWSPSGKAIAIACHRNDAPNPTIKEGRICLVEVEIQQ